MNTDEVRLALFEAAKLRFPRLRELSSRTARVEALEDYLVETAIARGQLEEARLYVHEALDRLMAEWDDIEGWEMQLANRRTQDDIRRAKKTIRPDLHDSIRAGKHVAARLSEQIRRLEGDDAAASRVYTMVTGG